jgi:hypothetical protein
MQTIAPSRYPSITTPEAAVTVPLPAVVDEPPPPPQAVRAKATEATSAAGSNFVVKGSIGINFITLLPDY